VTRNRALTGPGSGDRARSPEVADPVAGSIDGGGGGLAPEGSAGVVLEPTPVGVRPRRRDAQAEQEARLQDEAVRAFRERYPDVRLAPVVVIIPAYNEEECIGTVLPAVPRQAFGLAFDSLVVDDGSADGTFAAALAHGVYVARLNQNSGQGSALRLGYRLAREHGARFIVTLDADGQWDPADIVPLLEPLIQNEADFVLGSRKLGRAETTDNVRRAGVHVFAKLLRLLTRVPITDTSTGVRAMRAEVTATVRQVEPQYQASELLIGAIYQGYRITERPVVMRRRVAGESKKGHNLFYGLRYGRVLLRTWWRERRAAKRRNTAVG
jgi:glycosyltransferase involved in cell wall biosynthesis